MTSSHIHSVTPFRNEHGLSYVFKKMVLRLGLGLGLGVRMRVRVRVRIVIGDLHGNVIYYYEKNSFGFYFDI